MIRPATPQDRAAVSALWEAAFGYPEARNVPGEVFDAKLAFQPEGLLVLLDGEELIGTVMVGYDGHRGWIYRMAVQPDRRGRGHGRTLMVAAHELLRRWGCRKVNLQVKSSNDPVVRFYENLGYEVEPRVSLGRVLKRPDNG